MIAYFIIKSVSKTGKNNLVKLLLVHLFSFLILCRSQTAFLAFYILLPDPVICCVLTGQMTPEDPGSYQYENVSLKCPNKAHILPMCRFN